MSDINCPECGHDIDSHYCLFTEDGYPEWCCDGGDHCDCHQSASEIARALLGMTEHITTAYPNQKEMP